MYSLAWILALSNGNYWIYEPRVLVRWLKITWRSGNERKEGPDPQR